jgi:hypothetical protein
MFQLPPVAVPPGGQPLLNDSRDVTHLAFKVTAVAGISSGALFFSSPVLIPLVLSVLSLIPGILLAIISKGNPDATGAGMTLSFVAIKGSIALFTPIAAFIYTAKVAYIASFVFGGVTLIGLTGMYITKP